MAPSPRPRIRLLGTVSVHERSKSTALPVGGVGAIFVRLALEPGVRVPTDELVDLLWADEPPSTARHTIAVHASNLRSTLSKHRFLSDALRGDRGSYCLRVPETEVDAVAVLKAAAPQSLADPDCALAALALVDTCWKGAPLPGLVERVPGLQPFAKRVLNARARIAAAAAEALLERDDVDAALAVLEPAVLLAPADEALLLLLMRVLSLRGNRDQALEVYRAGARAINQEGMEVSAALQQAQRALSADEPALIPTQNAAGSTRTGAGEGWRDLAELAARYATSMRIPTAAQVRELDGKRGEIGQVFTRCEAENRWDIVLSLAVALRVYWWIGGWPAPGLRWLLLGLRRARIVTEEQAQRGHYYIGHLAETLGNLPLACASADTAAELARQRGETLTEGWVLLLRARLDRRLDRTGEAAEALRIARDRFEHHEDTAGLASALSEEARQELHFGHLSSAAATVAHAVAFADLTGQADVRCEAALAETLVWRAQDESALMATAATRATHFAIECGDRRMLPRALLLLAEAHATPIAVERLRGAAAGLICATGSRLPEDTVPTPQIWAAWMEAWSAVMSVPDVPWMTEAMFAEFTTDAKSPPSR